MAVDRVHRTPRILDGGEKGMLRDVEGAGPVRQKVTIVEVSQQSTFVPRSNLVRQSVRGIHDPYNL